jgi:adenine-specific DNA-methyltransferase
VVPTNFWDWKFAGHTDGAKKETEERLGPDAFDTPKPVLLIQRMCQLGQCVDDDIVLDFFAGSGTTADAVMQMNATDGGKRRVILVQLEEPISHAKYGTLAEVTKARLRALYAIKSEVTLTRPDLDTGFRVLKIDVSNMKDVFYTPDESKQGDLLKQIDNIREDRTPEDLLFQVLVDWGVDLALPIAQETIDGKTVFFVDGNALAACFDQDVTDDLVKEIAKRKPLRAVFRDSSYSNDSVKINVEQIFKLLAPSTEIRSL